MKLKFKKPKRLGWIITGVVVAILVVFSMMPKPVKVEVYTIQKQRLLKTIDAEGRTKYTSKYLIALPATGTVSRILIEPGDSVHQGQVVATYTPPVLDARQKAEAAARFEAASEMEQEARARLAAMRPLVDQSKRRADRTKSLLQSGAVSKEQAENAADAHSQLMNEFTAAESRAKTASYEKQAARAAISAAPGQRIDIVSPIIGVVLRRFEDQEHMLMAGSPLLEVGDQGAVEIVIDVLSTDAVRIKRDMPVLILGWGGSDTLHASIHKVEPAARIKVSSLGVEEKRVDVIATLAKPPKELGDGYKVDAGIITWEGESVITVPLNALVREDSNWFVYVVEEKKAVKRSVKIGNQASLMAEVLEGLNENDVVVKHPPETLKEGTSLEW